MKVVIVDGDCSYPPTSGKRLRTLNLMLPLARRHEITYLARASGGPAEVGPATEFLRDHGIEPVLIDDPLPRKKGLGFAARLAANLLSPLPYSVASHYSTRLKQAARELGARRAIDLWQLEWAGYLYARPAGARAVVIAHNVETLIWQRYHEAETSSLRRWYVRQQWRKMERFERRALHEASCVVAVSRQDAELMQRDFDVRRVEVVDNGVDLAYFAGVEVVPASRQVLYLGALDWRPNLDALRLLLDDIFPRVRAVVGDATLAIVGRSPPGWLRERARGEAGVELHADVPDVRPYLAGSAAMAVPLRIGGGSRLKILEALACGLPVVSTRVGAEGLDLRPGEDYDLADTPEEMAVALVRCLERPDEARARAAQGREVVRGRYDWGQLAERLEAVWRACAPHPAVPGPPGPAQPE